MTVADLSKQIRLDGLTTLDADTVAALAEFKGRALSLNGLTAIDAVAVAQALATKKGPLALPNLEKISPRTLSALIEKRDIVIPVIEKLKLIPEPDGSPTDDFVIPAWLQERQEQQQAGQQAAEQREESR
jgi:hypothetical protein